MIPSVRLSAPRFTSNVTQSEEQPSWGSPQICGNSVSFEYNKDDGNLTLEWPSSPEHSSALKEAVKLIKDSWLRKNDQYL